MGFAAIAFWTVAVALLPSVAWAMQTVQVGPSGAIVFAEPKTDSAMTGTLRPGQTVRTDDQPVSGYYHIAVGRKYVGWVQQFALDISRAETPAAPVVTGRSVPVPEAPREPPTSYVALFGGLAIPGKGSSTFGFGLSGGYKISRMWNLGMYFEYLTLSSGVGSASGQNEDTEGSNSLVSASSGKASLILATVELNYYIPRVPGLYVGVKGGLGMATANATSNATSTTSGNNNGLGPVAEETGANTSSFALGGGAAVGYVHPVYQQLISVGAESNVFLLTGDLATTIINVMASVRFIF